jgi:hypothetical protein
VLDTGADGAVATAPVRGARAQWLVGLNTYRADLLSELWESEMFGWAGAVAATVPVHVVARPDDGWTVDAVADAVEQIASES